MSTTIPTSAAIPGGRYAVVTHEGPYDDLDLSYGAVGAHVAALHRVGPGPVREHYVVGPTETDDPTEFRTDVHWPLAAAPGDDDGNSWHG